MTSTFVVLVPDQYRSAPSTGNNLDSTLQMQGLVVGNLPVAELHPYHFVVHQGVVGTQHHKLELVYVVRAQSVPEMHIGGVSVLLLSEEVVLLHPACQASSLTHRPVSRRR